MAEQLSLTILFFFKQRSDLSIFLFLISIAFSPFNTFSITEEIEEIFFGPIIPSATLLQLSKEIKGRQPAMMIFLLFFFYSRASFSILISVLSTTPQVFKMTKSASSLEVSRCFFNSSPLINSESD